MFDFLGDIGKALQDTRFDYAELLLYGVIIGFLIILLVILVIILPPFFAKRSRRIKYFGVDLDSLEKMKSTGLISDEEYRLARQKLRDHFIKDALEEEGKAETKSALAELLSKQPALSPELSGKPGAMEPKPAKKQEQALKEPAPPEAEKPQPIGPEDLFKKGLITEEEFKELSKLTGPPPNQQDNKA